MNNEIKEKMTIGKAKKILRGFLEKDCYYDTPLYYAIPYLLDYITNLQQENERLKEQNINEILKKDLEICTKQYKKSEEKLEKYKSRIEKAVEYIEHNTFQDSESGWVFTFYKGKEMLLDILNGRSDE